MGSDLNRFSNPTVLGKGFNFFGHFYNPAKRLFLANQPEKAITKSVKLMRFHSHILVVGGGADNTLLELFQNNKCTDVTHLDISSVFSKKAKNRFAVQFPESVNKVHFETLPFLDFESEKKFDAIIFPFYLDLFIDEEVSENIKKTLSVMKPNGVIYVIDFLSSKNLSVSKKAFVQLLYGLFFPFTRIHRKEVPDYISLFFNEGFQKTSESMFFNWFQYKSFKKA